MAEDNNNIIQEVTSEEYKWGFVTNIETDTIGKGLNEDVIRIISKKKNEPEWLLEFRLEAFRKWQTMKEPEWGHLLPGHHLLCRSQAERAEEEPR